MPKKFKKEMTQEIMNKVESKYDYSQPLDIPMEELTDI
jgi:hypothetical protein